MAVKEITQETFEQEVLKNKTPIVVDFWAPWCMPCKQLSPILDSLSDQFQQKLLFAKVNAQDNPDISNKYSIRGIPCLIVFNEGKEIDRIIGFNEEATLRSKLDLILAKAQ